MEFALHAEPEDLSLFAADWERLYLARSHEPSVSLEWTEALRNHHLRGAERFHLLSGQEHGRTRLLVPLVSERLSVGGLPLRSLRALSELSNTHSDLLCDSLDDVIGESLVDALRQRVPDWDILRFARVLEDSTLDRVLTRAVAHSALPARFRLEAPSFFLALPDNFDTYLRGRSAHFRTSLRRMEKHLSARGTLRFLKVDCAADFSDAYQTLLEVERTSWKHDHGTAISAVPHQTGFYRQMAAGALDAGRLHLTFLYLDDIPVAYNLGLLSHGNYHYLKTSFHEAYRRDGVATVARARLIRMLVEEGVRVFDFPGEPYEWETQWTQDLRWHRSVVICNNTAMGRMYHMLSSLRDRLRPRGQERSVTYCDPRALKAPRDARP